MIFTGDSLDILKTLPDNSIDSVVTDPPYGLKFMGKRWDHDVPSTEMWREAYRVLKPGGHLLSFGGTRTYHRMVVNLEDAGFEIRDQLQWLFGSGFPKSHDISKAIDKAAGVEREVVGESENNRDRSKHTYNSVGNVGSNATITAPATEDAKQWQGFGTALKPANEPIVLARKPLDKGLTVAENVLKYGTGALNIDGCRIGTEQVEKGRAGRKADQFSKNAYANGQGYSGHNALPGVSIGRWPANVILDEDAAKMLDEQSGTLRARGNKTAKDHGAAYNATSYKFGGQETGWAGDSGGASRFFYIPKASKRERNMGCERVITWECVDQNLAVLMDELNRLLKDISENTMQELSAIEWSTLLSGNSTMDLFRKAIKSTISTVIRLIIELKTSKSLAPLSIKGSIRDAIEAIEESGLSLAESVEHISQLQQSITSETMVSALGVVLAVLQTLLKIRGLAKQGNVHSTVKPIKLMQYLCRLITPPGGTVLDPFMGSGSTGVACVIEGFEFVGIELNPEYVEIAEKRIGAS